MSGAGAATIVPGASVAHCDLDVVAIGASAGGVTALPVVLSVLPVDYTPAVLVVLHLGPQYRSVLTAVLARRCRLPVRQAASGDIVRGGVVYVAPPAAHLVLRGEALSLTDAAPVHFVRPSVDVLFESVAAACGPRAVGVVLTGTGVDGAAGLRAIKHAGGRTIVQNPANAAYAGMPSAARATGCADRTLLLNAIGRALVALASRPRALAGPKPADG